MLKKLHLKLVLLLAAMVMGVNASNAETKTYKHVLTSGELDGIGKTSATLSDNNGNVASGVSWTVTPTWGTTPNAQNVDGTKGQQYGSNNKAARSLVFSTSHDFGTITAVKVNASTAASANATIAVQVGSTSFTYSSNSSANLTTTATEYEFTGNATGTITITLSQPSTNKALYVKSLEVTYEVGAPVAVTGVALDKSTAEVEVGSTVTLTPTITPANASNKTVNWSSSDPEVATVVGGVVTGVAKGTATITVTTVVGGYSADCSVTVKNSSAPTVTLDFSTNDWGISENPDKTIDETSFTSGGYTIKLEGSAGNGYYFDSDNVMLGKLGAKLTLPAFPFNVKKIVVYGTDGASGSVSFNIFVGEDEVSTEATSSKVTHTFEIASDKQSAGTVYVIKVTNANNMRISKIDIFGYDNITVSDAGYATYCSASALNFEDITGLTAYTASMNGNIVEFNEVTGTVAAGTGLLVEAAEGTYSVPAVATGTDVSATNKLIGTVAGTTIDGTGSDAFYVLKKNEKVGFYRVTNSAYKVRANSAYLAVPGGSAKEFIGFDGTTGLDEELTVENVFSAPVYNLQGQRVSEAYKGVVIVNGKKFVNK